jgi:hypothetical protein
MAELNENGKIVVFDLDCVEREKEPIDAIECVDRLGWTYDRVEPKKPGKPSKNTTEIV